MLLPVLKSAQDTAYKADCTNNSKQIALAMASYSGDFGCYPPGWEYAKQVSENDYQWLLIGYKYVNSGKSYLCPSVADREYGSYRANQVLEMTVATFGKSGNRWYSRIGSYAYNLMGVGDDYYGNNPKYPISYKALSFKAPKSMKNGGTKNPARLIATAEMMYPLSNKSLGSMPCSRMEGEEAEFDGRHQDKFNASFVDGSVRQMEIPDDMTYKRNNKVHDEFFRKHGYRDYIEP